MVIARRSGFTLIELAIVLVVIGLIVGGILIGQTMIRQSQLQGTIKDIDMYLTATKRFRDKYYYLPGDLPTATNYWGAVGGACNTTGTGTQTSNGNGNGMLAESCELPRFWQHLVNEGLISGNYTGIYNAFPNYVTVGINAPPLPYQKACIMDMYIDNMVGSGSYFDDNYRNIFVIGDDQGAWTSSTCELPILNPEDSLSIDSKMDDGRPGYGRVKTPKLTYSGCITTDVAATSRYDTSKSGVRCYLMINFNF